MQRWFYSIVPYKVISAIASILVILLVISMGGGAVEVGMTAAALTMGVVLGSLLWTKVIFKSEKRFRFIYFGYFGLFLTTLAFYFVKEIALLLLVAFLFNLLRTPVYFASLALIKDEEDLDIKVGKFEELSGWAWVVGLLAGFVLTSFLSERLIFLSLSLSSIFSLLVVIPLLFEKIVVRMSESLLRDIGWMAERGIKFILNEERMLVEKAHSGLRKVAAGSFMPSASIIKIARPRNLSFHLIYLLLYLSFGLALSQSITLVKQRGFTDSAVFGLTVLFSMASAIFYLRAAKSIVPRKLSLSVLVRASLFALLAFSTLIYGLPFLSILLIFFFLSGAAIAYIKVTSDITILTKSADEIGVNNMFRHVGYMMGSFLSGLLVLAFGFFTNFALAAFLALATAILFLKIKI